MYKSNSSKKYFKLLDILCAKARLPFTFACLFPFFESFASIIIFPCFLYFYFLMKIISKRYNFILAIFILVYSIFLFCSSMYFAVVTNLEITRGVSPHELSHSGKLIAVPAIYTLSYAIGIFMISLEIQKRFPSKINWLNLIIKTLVGILYLPVAFVVLSYIVAYLPPMIDIVFYNWVVMILSFAFIFAYLGFFPFGKKFAVFAPIYYSQERLD